MTREEAIKTIRLTCPKISDSECDFETAMRFLIPELAESEDERIRKWLIHEIEAIYVTDGIVKNENADKALAWLEKQKEQKEIPLMNGDADLYFDEWNQQNQNPTKRQCFEEGMRYAQKLQKEQMLKDAVEGQIYGSDGAHWIESEIYENLKGKEGDKVRIVVLKEEEE